MKQTVKASIGGVSFNIEEDAYTFLEQYIESIRKHLSSSNEAQEVINDIDIRIAELLNTMLGQTEIITLEMARNVADTIGKPQDFSSETDDEDKADTANGKQKEAQTKRKLYRDTENGIIGGVCSGLGAFFNADTLIFRIILAVLVLANGLGLIIYAVLWLAVPRAETPRQRLEMKGEDFNLTNLEKQIQDEYEQVKKNLKKRDLDKVLDKIVNFIINIFKFLGGVIEVFVKVILAIIGICLMIAGLSAIFAIIVVIFFHDTLIVEYIPALSGVSINDFVSSTIDYSTIAWLLVSLIIIIGVPLILLVYLGIKMVFRFRARSSVFLSIIASIWAISVVTLAFVVLFQARSFTISETVTEKIPLVNGYKPFTTLLVTTEGLHDSLGLTIDDWIRIDQYTISTDEGKVRVIGKPKVFFKKSYSDNYEIVIEKTARGATKRMAIANAEGVVLNQMFKDSTFIISPYFYISEGKKWRIQDVTVNVYIPEDGRVRIHSNMEKIICINQEHSSLWPDELAGHTWVMKRNGLVEY